MNMKKYVKRNSHISSKTHMIYIYLPIMIDTLFLGPSLHFTTHDDTSLLPI